MVLLISPNAAKIYQDNLEAVEDPEISHGFTFRGYGEGFDNQLASSLKGKVILLPYTFKTIFPSIPKYVDKLKHAQHLEKQLMEIREADHYIQIQKECLESFIECEHMERATEIFNDLEFNLISSEAWASTLEMVLHGLLHALVSGDESLIFQWKEKFFRLGEFFCVDKFQFVPMIEDKIRLEKINNISPLIFANILDKIILLFGQKVSMIGKEKIDKRIDTLSLQLQRLRVYLEPWLKSKLTYKEYIDIRKEKHLDEILTLTAKLPEYRRNGVEDPTINEIIKQIEVRDLEDIFGGSLVRVNLDFDP